MVLDDGGEVLRPAKLWNDTESAPDADALVEELGAEAWAEACGSVPVASFTITKLAWLRRCEPETFARVARVLLPHDWLTHRLTGAWTTDRGDASGTGWWSPAEDHYRSDLLDLVGRRREALAARRCSGHASPPASGTAPSWPRAPATTWPPPSGSGSGPATWR